MFTMMAAIPICMIPPTTPKTLKPNSKEAMTLPATEGGLTQKNSAGTFSPEQHMMAMAMGLAASKRIKKRLLCLKSMSLGIIPKEENFA